MCWSIQWESSVLLLHDDLNYSCDILLANHKYTASISNIWSGMVVVWHLYTANIYILIWNMVISDYGHYTSNRILAITVLKPQEQKQMDDGIIT